MAKKIDYASMFTLRKDGRYCASYTDDTGRHYLYDRDPEKLWHKLNDPKPVEVVTFSRCADAWEREHWEHIGFKTAEAYTAPLRRLKEQFGPRPVQAITASDISVYLSSLARQSYSRRSVQMHRDIANMILNHAILLGHLTANPCAAVSLPRNLTATKRQLPDDAAVDAVKSGGSVTFGLFALICLYSGLRRGEALALRYDDIDRKNHVIHVTKSVEFVGNNPHLKLPKTAAGYRDAVLLDVLADQIPEGTGYIFCTDKGALLTKTMYRRRWEKYCKEIGHDITAHQLRHGFATILYEAGIGDKDAQELLGHSNITITRNVYTHIRQSRKTETADKLNTFLASPSP